MMMAGGLPPVMAGDVVSPQMQPRAPHWMPMGAPQTIIPACHRGSTSIGKVVMGLATATRLQGNATDQAMQRRKLVTGFFHFYALEFKWSLHASVCA